MPSGLSSSLGSATIGLCCLFVLTVHNMTPRLINPQTMMLGQEPRQTTSNLGHLNKPSIQALIHGLNRHYYSISISYRWAFDLLTALQGQMQASTDNILFVQEE